MRVKAHQRFVLFMFCLHSCAGCADAGYLLHVTGGEMRSLARSRSIDSVLARGSVTPEQAEKLRLVQRLRIFARDRIGLEPGRAYTQFEDNVNDAVAYAVSGACMDRLEPYHWTYPVIGVYDARGFFDLDLARNEAARLRQKGYDVFVGEVAGFSTMGILPDPVRASNLRMDEIDLADLILHELTHNTIFKPSDTQFNENMATFVGRAAAQRYFDDNFGADSPQAVAARNRFADLRLMDAYVTDLYRRLTDLYDQPISREEKIARRQAVFDEHRRRFFDQYERLLHEPRIYQRMQDVATNNATVLGFYRYHASLDLFADVFSRLDHDFCALLDLLRQAAKHRDSRAFLRHWLHHAASTRPAAMMQAGVRPR